MTEARLPETGEVEITDATGAADLVEEIAHETAAADAPDAPDATAAAGDPSARTPRLLIVLDIDGTVILEDESLSPGVVDAIEDAHAVGHRVMIATGRSWEGTVGILRALGIAPEFVVCSNGAVVLKRDGDVSDAEAELRYERFHVETFDPAEVLTMLREHLPDAHYLVELPDGQRLYTEYLDDWNLTEARRVPFRELSAQPVCRVVVVAPEQGEQDFVDLVARIGLNQVSYAVGWTAWLDIAPQGVDKSTGLQIVRDELGVAPHDVLVIGDGRNDLGMFRWAREHGGRAVAMQQGPQEVRDAASDITLSVQEGGVAAVLRAL